MSDAKPTLTTPDPSTTPDRLGNDEHRPSSSNQRRSQLQPHYHEPLKDNSKSIRLLEVHLEPTYEPISCRLVQHDLADKPLYIALSYKWDEGGLPRGIMCDGMDLEVGENLWHFLYEFRRRQCLQKSNTRLAQWKDCYLWIDAICIDQMNLQERDQQVPRMGGIYSTASSVIAWLGRPCRNEELAFLLTRHPELIRVRKFQRAVLDLLNKPYFTRVWVVQEFVLADSVTIWCGELFAEALAFDELWSKYHAWLPEPLFKTPGWPLFKYREDFRSEQNQRSGFRLRDLLMVFSTSQCTEAYDKIYGFLGIVREANDRFPIRPGYSKPPIDVLIEVLRNQCCQQYTNLDENNHDLLMLLMQILPVPRDKIANSVIRNNPVLAEDIYLLAVPGNMTASVYKIGWIVHIGDFEEIEGLSGLHVRDALFKSSESLRDIPWLDIPYLSHTIADPKAALGLEFDWSAEGSPSLKSTFRESGNTLVQGLIGGFYKFSHSHPSRLGGSQFQRTRDLSNKDIRQLLQDSLTSISETYLTEQKANQAGSGKINRKYAVFEGSHGLVGITCDVNSLENIHGRPLEPCFVYAFANERLPKRAMLVRRYDRDRLTIVGFAIIGTPTSSTRRGSTSYYGIEPEDFCFHFDLSDLVQLYACGVLNGPQLEHLLEQGLPRDRSDEVHKCKLGEELLPCLPCLEFRKKDG